MKTLKLNLILAVVTLLIAAQSQAQTIRYQGTTPGSGSKVTIDGDSTAHKWTVEGKIIGGTMEIDSDFDADLKKSPKTIKADIIIPVRQIKSDKTAMDNVMYDAMKAETNRTIKFHLIEVKQKDATFSATGTLTVAGVTRTNTMPVTFERIDASKIKISGSTPLKMTDFEIKPPVLVGITTDDNIKISFDWVVEKKDAAK